jgi:LysR substrate binding domain
VPGQFDDVLALQRLPLTILERRKSEPDATRVWAGVAIARTRRRAPLDASAPIDACTAPHLRPDFGWFQRLAQLVARDWARSDQATVGADVLPCHPVTIGAHEKRNHGCRLVGGPRRPNGMRSFIISQTPEDLVRGGFDLAVRLGPLSDSALVAVRLGTARGGYYASPAYLKRKGAPGVPADLSQHDLIAIPRWSGPIDWAFPIGSKRTTVRAKPRLRATDFELSVRAAVAGVGIILAPEHFVTQHLARRRLRPVLQRFTQPGIEVHAVTPAGGPRPPRTKASVDLLRAHFERTR